MKRGGLFILLLIVCVTQSGCELLSLPAEILGGMFGLAGQAIGAAASVASTMPMPPPWVFF